MAFLKRPVHFVAPKELIWPELLRSDFEEIPEERLAKLCIGSLDGWILRSYYELRKNSFEVSLSDRCHADRINICDIYSLGRRVRGFNNFIVVPRGDGHDSVMANYLLLQNERSTSDKPFSHVRFWLQPGIRARDARRGARIENIVFKGSHLNLDACFKSSEFSKALRSEGATLKMSFANQAIEDGEWGDYEAADLVLAVRNLTSYDAARKPASKLINAWFADVPALLGPEPAFAEIGTRDVDYIEVTSPSDVIGAIREFRASPARYLAMIEAGRRKRELYSDAANLKQWIDALNGPVSEEFDKWRALPEASRIWQASRGILGESARKKMHRKGFTEGPRIL